MLFYFMLFINYGVFGIWFWMEWLNVCLFLHIHIQVDEQLTKAIMPFWDPSYKCFTFNQKDMVLTVEEHTTLLWIEISNPNKVIWKKTKGVGFVKKMSQILGLDTTIIGQMKTIKGKNESFSWEFLKKFLAKCEDRE